MLSARLRCKPISIGLLSGYRPLERSDNWMDVETVNAILRLLEEELQKYPPDSEAALALWAFMERLSE